MGKEDSDTDGAGVLDRAPEPPALHEEDERTNVLSVWVGHETLRRDRLALSCQRRRSVEVGTGRHGAGSSGNRDTPDRGNEAVPAQPRKRACARQESNLRPRAPEARALSPELRAPERLV